MHAGFCKEGTKTYSPDAYVCTHTLFPDDDIFTRAALRTMERPDLGSCSPTDFDSYVKLTKEASTQSIEKGGKHSINSQVASILQLWNVIMSHSQTLTDIAARTTICASKLHALRTSSCVTQCALACHDLVASLNCSSYYRLLVFMQSKTGARVQIRGDCAKKLKQSVRSTYKGQEQPWDINGQFEKQVADKYLHSAFLGLFIHQTYVVAANCSIIGCSMSFRLVSAQECMASVLEKIDADQYHAMMLSCPFKVTKSEIIMPSNRHCV